MWGKIPTSGVPSILEDAVVWFNGNMKGKSMKCLIMRSIVAAAVYVIWKERNLRVFQGCSSAVDHVSIQFVNTIRDFLSSRRGVKPFALNKSLGACWSLPACIFS